MNADWCAVSLLIRRRANENRETPALLFDRALPHAET